MFFELVLVLLIGIIIGTLTGLAPGIHINLVAAITLSSLPLLAFISPLSLAVFITVVALTHTCVDFIPSIYLGAPEEDTYLTVLPGHEMLKQGQAHEAILLALLGIIIGLIISLPLIPFYLFISPIIEKFLIKIVAFTLIAISLFMIFREEKSLIALVVFILAGFLGYVSLNLPINEPLLPLLTGLFGASSILLSLKDKVEIVNQNQTRLRDIEISKKDILNSSIGALVTLPFFSILPALGSGYATLTASETLESFKRDISRKAFLILSGAINTAIMISSFILVYTINKARTGASAALKKLITTPTLEQSIIIVLSIILATIVAVLITVYLSKKSSIIITKINYQKLSLVVILIIIFFTGIISGYLGLLVLATSTSLGIFAISSRIKRTHLMASLIIPTIIYYLLS